MANLKRRISGVASFDQVERLGVEGVRALGLLCPMAGADDGPPAAPRTVEEIDARMDEIRLRLQEIDSSNPGTLPDEERTEWNNISEELTSLEKVRDEKKARQRWLENVQADAQAREAGADFGVRPARSQTSREDIWDLTTIRSNFSSPDEMVIEAKDRAKRAIESWTFPHEDVRSGRLSQERVRQHLEHLLETTNEDGQPGALALYMLRCGSPTYARAFGKKAMGHGLTTDEERALSSGVGSAGGFAVPITIDPTLIPTSNGVVNPLRALARKETIVGLEYRGLTSGAVVASYVPEGQEATDNSPTLAQPDVFVERAQTFIPYSIEIGMDWNGLQAGMAKLIADAKDVVEGLKFTLGAGHGSNEPSGLITGATSTVSAGGSSSFAIADLYALEEALPPRFRPLGQFFGNRHIYNLIRQFGQNANQNLWMPIVSPAGGPLSQGLANEPFGLGGNLGQKLIGYGTNEVSDMTTSINTGSKVLAIGDPNYYLIVDRIGLTVELIPHLFGANRRPTGQRGMFAYWRNTGVVVDPNAWRVLVTS